MQKLSDLRPGEFGIVNKLGSKGALRRRIIDMGITPGVKIRVVKFAPFGDPIEINVHGYNLSIRKSEADQIELYSKEQIQNNVHLNEHSSIKGMHRFTLPPVPKRQNGLESYNVALIGNPNSGKTTLFNALTGSYQYVGNWPGVTVERKEGNIKNIDVPVNLIDLPGVYSLSPYSPEEIVTRNYIIDETPDVIINILDATNLERNLYLTMQLMELDCRIILVLNMMDLLSSKGKEIDFKVLEKKLGVPVVPVSAGRNMGIDNFLNVLSDILKSPGSILRTRELYSDDVENALDKIDKMINPDKKYYEHQRFKNVKIFEDDSLVITEKGITHSQAAEIEKMRDYISKKYDKEKDTIIANERYDMICEICNKAIKIKNKNSNFKNSFSDKLDFILTGKYTALPCFLIFVLSIFYCTFGPLGILLKEFFERFINGNTKYFIEKILDYVHASSWSKSLVLDAVIGGVGAVVTFLPQVIILFTLISLLEDCGYMSRAAFIMDRPFRKIGLSGKAFVPMIMGFGCTVPAVMGTKILESKKDRNMAIFLIPFMSCSAKMPLYLVFASAFFPNNSTLAVFSIYAFGVLVAIMTSYLFKDTVFKGEDAPFIMEMPEYKIPSPKNVFMSVWDRTRDFVERAGTVILVATIAVWFLQSFGLNFRIVTDNSKSILAYVGSFISPIFKLCGFSDWRICVSLVTGLLAKESIVSTLQVLYSGSNIENFTNVLLHNFSLPSAISFLIFSLLYTPCVAALSTIHKELKDFRLTSLMLIYQFFVAFVLSAFAYQMLNFLVRL